jgi:predicted dehydrogenase
MSKLRIGIVGAGAIAHSGAQAVKKHEQAVLAAAAEPSKERLQNLCEAYEIAHGYATADELFADKKVDAVYIAVPNKLHAPIAISALKAGKHVILDKPFAMNLAEAEEVVATAQAAGKVFMLGMNQRYRADSQKIKALVEQGVLGDVYHGKAYWIRRAGIPRLGTWFGNKEMAGGGALLDIGVHLLDLCLFCMGNFEPQSVSGAVYTKFGNRGLGEGGWGHSDRQQDITFDVDDFASAMIRLKNGATVMLDVTWACHTDEGDRMDVRLFGTEAGAGLYPARIFRNDPLRTDYDVIENVNAPVALTHECRFTNFINTILGTEKPLVTVGEALAVQKILDGIYESARTGQEVRI